MSGLPVSISEEITQFLYQVYGDLLSPPFKKVGQALETVFDYGFTFLLPLKLKSEKAKLNFKYCLIEYQKKLESVPEDQIVDVPPELGLPILDKFTHVTNEDIREMYVKLLFSASVQTTMSLAHPSALRIIESLSPDEAKIINHIKVDPNYPFISIQLKLGLNEGYRTIDKYLMGIEKELELSFPENIPLYIDNLLACGVYQYIPGRFLTDSGIYEKIEDAYSELIENRRRSIIQSGTETEIDIVHDMISKSIIGDRFIRSCCT